MKIGLHDAEREYLKNKHFPNYALMKISAWHKAQGDAIEWWNPLYKYDRVYSSKVFDFTPVDPYLPEDAIRGGTGYRDIPMSQTLPTEIDDIFPDYSIYPECDFAIGYLTRGCPNNCRWCVVPQKEGKIQPYRTWEKLVRQDTDKLVLMDNNILACEYGITQLESLIGSGYQIDLNQGMDARLVNDRVAHILSQLRWIRYIRFSCDQKAQIEPVKRTIELLGNYGVKPYRVFIYLLVTTDIRDAAERVEALKEYKGINLFAQAERNERLGISPNKLQLEFQQRYIYSGRYRKEIWEHYCERKNLKG
ncbi:MAG: radical SAM protein [Lachnospiraceae bacterium]|nr:radical SAM protein [Lachnospiraceae bacterium]